MRDFYSIFNVHSYKQVDVIEESYRELARYFALRQVDKRHASRPLKIKEALRTKYRQIMGIVNNAKEILLNTRLGKGYDTQKEAKPTNVRQVLPKWMWELTGVRYQQSHSYFRLLEPGNGSKLELNMLDTVVYKGAEPKKWLFTDQKRGVVTTNADSELPFAARRAISDMLINMGHQVKEMSNIADPNVYVATFYVPGGDGTTRQLATEEMLEVAMKGQSEGVTAVQRMVALKHSSSVYRNTFLLQEKSPHALQSTMVVSCAVPGIGKKGKVADYAACYREEKCTIAALNRVLDTATRRISNHIEAKMSQAGNLRIRVLKLTVEYVQDVNNMIWMSHIKELYTCEEHDVLPKRGFISPEPNPAAADTLTKRLSYWETFWIVGSKEGKYMADEPVVDLGFIPGTKFRMREFEELREYPEKQPQSIADAMETFDANPACLPLPGERLPGSTHYTCKLQTVPKQCVNFTSRKITGSPEAAKHHLACIAHDRRVLRQGRKMAHMSCAVANKQTRERGLRKSPEAFDLLMRSPMSALWEPAPPRPTRAPKPPPPPVDYDFGDPFGEEITLISQELEVDEEQTKLLYKAFQRIECDNRGHFSLPEFQVLLAKWGMTKASVVTRMFNAYCEKGQSTLDYKQTLRVLCALGVGAKRKQAEALFMVCDEDKEGTVSRGELLKFIAGSLPDDSSQHKTETFAKVGHMFMLLDEDGSGEISIDEWCDGISREPAMYQAFQTMNPYRTFFKFWNPTDFSLQAFYAI